MIFMCMLFFALLAAGCWLEVGLKLGCCWVEVGLKWLELCACQAEDVGEGFQAEDHLNNMAVEARGWETCDIHVYVGFCSV